MTKNCWWNPIRVVVVGPGEYPGLRDQYLVMRFWAFGMLEKSDPLRGREADDRDAIAPYVLVVATLPTDEQVVLAGCRILDGQIAPISLDPTLVGPERHCELSRFTIAESITGELRMWVKAKLLLAISHYAFKMRGYASLYCDTRTHFASSLVRCFGSAIQVLGAEHEVSRPGALVTLVPLRITKQGARQMRRRLMVALATMHGQRLLATLARSTTWVSVMLATWAPLSW